MTDFTKTRAEGGGTKGMAVGLFATLIVFGVGSTVVFGAIAAVVGIVLPVMTLAQWGVIFATIGATAWVGYRSRKELNEREQSLNLGERTDVEAAGEAVGLMDSGDQVARSHAAYVVSRAAEQGSGGVVKRSDASAEEIIAWAADLLDDDFRKARGNGAAVLSSFAYDYPAEVRHYDDALIEAAYRQETEVQAAALEALLAILRSPEGDEDAKEKYTDVALAAAEDEDQLVRQGGAAVLAWVEDERATTVLENLRDDPRGEVREVANAALSDRQSSRANSSSGEASSGGNDTSPEDDLIQSPPDMDFGDVAGMESLKAKLRERVIDPFTGEGAYADFGVGSESGVLLHGPPGTGKTHMAKCLAGELGINFIDAGVGNVESKWTGEGVENITNIFDQAHRNQPVLVFLDEFDALAPSRSGGDQNQNAKKQVNTLLQELSDIDESDDILVVGATNNADEIDDAMLRNGRLDSKIEVPKPDGEARVGIFQHHLSAPIVDEPDLDIDAEIKRRTTGCTGSDMERIAKQAARSAAKRRSGLSGDGNRDAVIEWRDVEQAIESVARESGGVGQFVERPPAMSFEDVAGMDELKEQLREKVIEPLKNPEMYAEYGISTANGFLFYGPPGTGKTHMARSLAGEMDVSYISAKASDLVSKWIGEGSENVAAMFDEARSNQPCLVFIDEIDALATDRGGVQQSKSERQMVNQLLEEIGSINENNEDVIVIGATNKPDSVDDALLRSGRLGEKIEVGAPDADARVGIFQHHLSAPSDELDYERIAEKSTGLVASDMEQVADLAARGALKQSRASGEQTPVSQSDVESAIDHIQGQKENRDQEQTHGQSSGW